nr:PREDICTED: uncharacterized protein LOC109037203 [Bemisia tabaci]
MYMDALTRTLLPSSYEISCTDPTLPIVKIRSTLYTLAPHLTPLPGISPLQSRLLGVDRSWMAPGDRLYPDEIIFALNRPDDHMSRKSEVERQLIKLGDGSFQQVQDSLGVFDSLKPIAPKIMSSYSLIKYNGQIHRTRQYQMTTTQSLPRVKVQGSISDGVFQIVYDISLAGTVLLFLFLLLSFGYNDNRDFYLMSKFPTQTKSKKLVFHVRNTIKYVTQQIQTMDFLEQAQTYTYQLGTVKMCSNIHYLLKYITVQP